MRERELNLKNTRVAGAQKTMLDMFEAKNKEILEVVLASLSYYEQKEIDLFSLTVRLGSLSQNLRNIDHQWMDLFSTQVCFLEGIESEFAEAETCGSSSIEVERELFELNDVLDSIKQLALEKLAELKNDENVVQTEFKCQDRKQR